MTATAIAPADAPPADLGPAAWQGLAAVASLLARTGDFDALLGRSPEPRDNRLHIGYGEAAERLNIPEKWLRERISTLPHRKLGKFVQFTEDDLRSISDMHFVQPGRSDVKEGQSTIMSLQPSKRSRKRL
ncbi:hypothetical protein [Streptomyces sp. NPDC093109]|uniref:hypothetical protein n=1 Tax=Streptomyces sp. NPDC093109 TaxID=3154977 RepID=UPI00344FDD29